MTRIGGICLEVGGMISLGGKRIAIAHGDLEQEVQRLLALQPDYLLSGHTHRFSDNQLGTTRRINPGAVHRAAQWTVGLLDLATNHLDMLPIIND
jgi:predicted phosphodiesterase